MYPNANIAKNGAVTNTTGRPTNAITGSPLKIRRVEEDRQDHERVADPGGNHRLARRHRLGIVPALRLRRPVADRRVRGDLVDDGVDDRGDARRPDVDRDRIQPRRREIRQAENRNEQLDDRDDREPPRPEPVDARGSRSLPGPACGGRHRPHPSWSSRRRSGHGPTRPAGPSAACPPGSPATDPVLPTPTALESEPPPSPPRVALVARLFRVRGSDLAFGIPRHDLEAVRGGLLRSGARPRPCCPSRGAGR